MLKTAWSPLVGLALFCQMPEQKPDMTVKIESRSIDVSAVVNLAEPATIAVEVFYPPAKPAALLFCFPGGGCNRHYFDLSVPGDDSYSFARSAAAAGFLVVTVDHLGVGESTRPQNGLEVTLDRIIAANAHVVEYIGEQFPSIKKRIAVGHSMGALLAILQQDAHTSFSAMAVLGFGNRGMIDQLGDYGKQLAQKPHTAKLYSVELASQQFGGGYFDIVIGDGRSESAVTPDAAASLSRGRGTLLAVPGALALVPGCVARETARITVPVFIAAGDRDITGSVDTIAKQFRSSENIETLTLLDAGHMHFVYESRLGLLKDFTHWVSTL